jgi:hypothetical protein
MPLVALTSGLHYSRQTRRGTALIGQQAHFSCSNTDMRLVGVFAFALALLSSPLIAQTPSVPPTSPAENYSGMYSFLQEGEFLQVTVEDAGRVTGFVSRYGDSDSDRGTFLDQFFKQGKLDGNKLSFTTDTVHGVWFEFSGTVDRGEGKTPADEAYYLIKGTLADFRTDTDKKVSSKSREVTFKSFPHDVP